MPLPDIIQRNFWLKVVSLLFATFIWLAIRFEMRLLQNPTGDEIVQTFRHIQIRVLTDTRDKSTYQVVPDEVTLTVSGELQLIRRLHERDFQVFVNAAQSTDLLQGYIRKVEVVKPLGVTLIKVEPSMVQVEVLQNPVDAAEPGKKELQK